MLSFEKKCFIAKTNKYIAVKISQNVFFFKFHNKIYGDTIIKLMNLHSTSHMLLKCGSVI